MINAVKTIKPAQPATVEVDRFEAIRKAAAERRRKSDCDGARRRDRQTVENNRLL